MRRGAVRLAVCGGSRKSCTFQEQDSAGSILYISGPGDKCWGEYFLLRRASVIVCRSSADFVLLFLALNTNFNQLCSRKYVKILLRHF